MNMHGKLDFWDDGWSSHSLESKRSAIFIDVRNVDLIRSLHMMDMMFGAKR